MSDTQLKVGGTIWQFDLNRRIYKPKQPGEKHSYGGPIYAEHWRPVEIKSETSRSWVTIHGKAPKTGPHGGWAFTQNELDDDVWIHDNRHRLSSAVMLCRDIDKLRAVETALMSETGQA